LFAFDHNLLDNARFNLREDKSIYWIVGGSCTGKSTVCNAMVEKFDLVLYDMDASIYGSFIDQYDTQRHPANSAWLSADNPLAWQLDLSLEQFDAFNRVATAEYLDLFAQDKAIQSSRKPTLVDGGITHPSILAKIIPPDQIVCLDAPRATCVNLWENSAALAEMKQWIFDLPEPLEKWKKFLECDALITRTIVEECHTLGIQYWMRDDNTSVDDLLHDVSKYFEFRM
jgi:hypothetical protein